MTSRLRPSDYRFIAICLGLLAASTWFSVRYFYLAFPEASIDFRVGRAEARTLAEQFLTGHQYRVTDYRTAASFDFDDNAKTFLEREVGLERANQIMGTRLRLWHWSYRWFRPQQKEEYRVDITPRGELAGFGHEIPEDAPRPAVSDDQARAAAEQFLRDALRRDPAALDFVEVSTITRAARADRLFTWKERDFDLNGASIRLEVRLLGNEVGGYREYLKIPEQWTRDYQRLRSKNDVAGLFDTFALLALIIGMVIVIVLRIRPRRPLAARGLGRRGRDGPFGVCFGQPVPASGIQLPYYRFLWQLRRPSGAPGRPHRARSRRPAVRSDCRRRAALPRVLSQQTFTRQSVPFARCADQVLPAGFDSRPVVVRHFYRVPDRLLHRGVPLRRLVAGRCPLHRPPQHAVSLGLCPVRRIPPAVSEEFLFRMFAIPFLRKLLRFLPAAVVLAGFIWGFGHAGYPQQPFYIRGVEVGTGGVVLGLIMLRWGILPTLVWHYSVDAMYTAMLLLRSPSLYFRLSGAASAGIMVLPVLFALIAYWRRGGLEPEAGLTNAQDTAPAAEQPAAAQLETAGILSYRPLTARRRMLAVAICLLGSFTLLIPMSHFGDSPNFRISATQAASAADAFARTQAIAPDAFRRVTYPDVHWGGGDDSLAGKYFLEHGNVARASSLFERNRPLRHWVTRYFRSLDQEELLVSVHPETANVLGFVHTIPEERPGADLSSDATLAVAGRFAHAHGINVDALDLKESTSEKKKARRDYRLVWEARPGDPRNLDEARYRVEIGVAGDQVASWRSYWKLPETFTRARSQQNFLSIALLTLRLGTIASVFVFGIWSLIGNIRQGLIRWGTVTRIAAPATLLTAIGPLLALPLLLKDYNTAIPLSTYQTVAYTTLVVSVMLGFVVLAAAIAFVTSFYPESTAALDSPNRRALGVDAVVAVLAAAGLVFALSQAEDWLRSRFASQALYSIDVSNIVASAAPALGAAAGAVRTVLLAAAALTLLALVVNRMRNRWALLVLGLVALTFPLPSSVRTPGEFALS